MVIKTQVTSFTCPLCEAGNLLAITRGEVPIYYHCQREKCSKRFEASWKLIEEENKLTEQAIYEGETYDLGKSDISGLQ